jgi:hypothetical protein
MCAVLTITFVSVACAPKPELAKEIIFSSKSFYDPGPEALFVAVSGTLTGNGVGYPNNSTMIVCYDHSRECLTYTVAQIGNNQIGSLDVPVAYPVVTWSAREIVASGNGDAFQCSKLTITLVRKSETALWVQEPINQSRPECKNADTTVRKWTIEDSPSWKAIFKQTQ